MAKYRILEYGEPYPDWNDDKENEFMAIGKNSIAVGRLRIEFTEAERRNIEDIWRKIDNGILAGEHNG